MDNGNEDMDIVQLPVGWARLQEVSASEFYIQLRNNWIHLR